LRPAANLQDVLLSRTKSHIHREPAKLQNGNVVYAKMLAAEGIRNLNGLHDTQSKKKSRKRAWNKY